MARWEVRGAWVIGVALPLLETLRRRTDFGEFAFYVDDYIAGGILLWAAWAASRGTWYGRGLLIGAWGILCGGLYPSFFGQLMNPAPRDLSGLANAWVVGIKGALFAAAIAGLALSIVRVRLHRDGAPLEPVH